MESADDEAARAAARRVLRAKRGRPQRTRQSATPLSLIVAVGLAAFLATGLLLLATQVMILPS